jgi:hypothetical protein
MLLAEMLKNLIVDRSRILYPTPLFLPGQYDNCLKNGVRNLVWKIISGSALIERRGTYSSKKRPHYDILTGRRTEASDHSAVVADFRV